MRKKKSKRTTKLGDNPYNYTKEKIKYGTFLYAVLRAAGLNTKQAILLAGLLQIGGVILLLYGTFLMVDFKTRFDANGCSEYCQCVPAFETSGFKFNVSNQYIEDISSDIQEEQKTSDQTYKEERVKTITLKT